MLTDLQSAWGCRTTATIKEAVVEVSVNYFLSDDPTRSPVDEFVNELALLRDEGFRRVWTLKCPTRPIC